MRCQTWLAMTPWIAAAALLLLVGCGGIHFNLHYHAPAPPEPEMTLEFPALPEEDTTDAQVDQWK